MSEDNEFHKMEAHEFMTFHCTLWRNGKPIQDSVTSHVSKMVVSGQSSGMAVHHLKWNHVISFLIIISSTSTNGCNVCFISLILFKSQWTEPITSGYICDSSFCLWQNWSKVKKKNPLLEILCGERNCQGLPYILWLFAWIRNSSFIRNHFRINITSKKSTNVHQKIFSICKIRGELGQKAILSLNRGFWPTTQRRWTGYWHSGWQKPNRHFQMATVFEFWSLLTSEYPEIAKHGRQHLLSFVSTYRCEAAVLKYALTENKQRIRLDPEADVWVQLFSIKPDFKNWSLESKHIHLICYMPSSMERVKWKISFNYGVFKCYSLKQLLFSKCGVHHFDFFFI